MNKELINKVIKLSAEVKTSDGDHVCPIMSKAEAVKILNFCADEAIEAVKSVEKNVDDNFSAQWVSGFYSGATATGLAIEKRMKDKGFTKSDLLILEYDRDGYPSASTLAQISAFKGDYNSLLKQIAPMFDSYGRCERVDNTWELVTGGWSGNESIIQALRDNVLFWALCWQLSKRGGYYEFICRT